VPNRSGWLTQRPGHFNPGMIWCPLHGKLGEP